VRVVIDGKQIAPDRPHNTVDEEFEAAGLKVIRDDEHVDLATRQAAHMLGVHSNALMHMKARVFTWKDEAGAVHREVLSGSLNPGGKGNDENLNRIADHDVAALYDARSTTSWRTSGARTRGTPIAASTCCSRRRRRGRARWRSCSR